MGKVILFIKLIKQILSSFTNWFCWITTNYRIGPNIFVTTAAGRTTEPHLWATPMIYAPANTTT